MKISKLKFQNSNNLFFYLYFETNKSNFLSYKLMRREYYKVVAIVISNTNHFNCLLYRIFFPCLGMLSMYSSLLILSDTLGMRN
jgi:hypothetical protein